VTNALFTSVRSVVADHFSGSTLRQRYTLTVPDPVFCRRRLNWLSFAAVEKGSSGGPAPRRTRSRLGKAATAPPLPRRAPLGLLNTGQWLSWHTGRGRSVRLVRPRTFRRRIAVFLTLLGLGAVVVAGLTAGRAVLLPRVDSPNRVDALVVVAGANDDRYVYARHLAEIGVADRILVSRPSTGASPSYSALIDAYCESSPVISRDGRHIQIECFEPDVDTTEGETTAATRIASARGFESLLIVTYWGHVSRVRIYFEQCFPGPVYVTDTPEPLTRSRKNALLHETGGYIKAFLKPAC